MTGKNEPFGSFGILSCTSPALVDNNRGREPLRSVTRVSVRSYRPAPILSAASVSISSCNTNWTDSRIRSTPSPARKAPSNSDATVLDNAIGGISFCGYCAVDTENLADGVSCPADPPTTQNPTTPGDSHGCTPQRGWPVWSTGLLGRSAAVQVRAGSQLDLTGCPGRTVRVRVPTRSLLELARCSELAPPR